MGQNTLGQVLFRRGAYAPAERLFREAVRCAATSMPTRTRSRRGAQQPGRCLFANGQFAAAEAVGAKHSRTTRRSTATEPSGVARGTDKPWRSPCKAGTRRKPILAPPERRTAERCSAQSTVCSRAIWQSLGVALQESRRSSEAEQHIRAPSRSARQALGSDHPQTGRYLDALGGVLRDRGAYAAAESRIGRRWRACREAPAAHPTWRARASGSRAAMLDRGDAATALDEARLGLEASRSSLPATHGRSRKRAASWVPASWLGSTNAESLPGRGLRRVARCAFRPTIARVRAAAGRLARAARAQRP